MCVYLYRGYPFKKKNGKKNKEIVKEKKKFLKCKSAGDSLWPWSSIVSGSQLPSTGQTHTRTPSGSSAGTRNSLFEELLPRRSKPLCLRAAAWNNVRWTHYSCPAWRKHTIPIILENNNNFFFSLFTHSDQLFWGITLHTFLRTQSQLPLVFNFTAPKYIPHAW